MGGRIGPSLVLHAHSPGVSPERQLLLLACALHSPSGALKDPEGCHCCCPRRKSSLLLWFMHPGAPHVFCWYIQSTTHKAATAATAAQAQGPPIAVVRPVVVCALHCCCTIAAGWVAAGSAGRSGQGRKGGDADRSAGVNLGRFPLLPEAVVGVTVVRACHWH